MSVIFKNILIPVDFTVNTDIAVKKAIELVETNNAMIHLLHVVHSVIPGLSVETYFPDDSFCEDTAVDQAGRRLVQWKNSIIEMFPNIRVEIHLLKGYNIQHQISLLAKKLQPQLIVIGKQHHHNWFGFLNTVSPDKLARMTNCPVLTARIGDLRIKNKSIVFPVQTFVPSMKIDMLITLANRYRAKIYLIILVNPGDEAPTPLYNAFIETYRQLTSSINRPVDYAMVAETNLAKAALDFAESIKADMILINPDAESNVALLTDKQVRAVITENSKQRSLTVVR